MSRLSRADTAKSTIAVWRWLHAHPEAPNISGTVEALLATLPSDIPNVSRETTGGLSDRLNLMEHLGLIRRESRHEYIEATDGSGAHPQYVGTTVIVERDVEKGAKAIGQHFARGGYLKLKAKGNQKANGNAVASAPRPNVEKVAIRTDERDRPVEAVVGEDAPTLGEAIRVGSPEVAKVLREMRKSEPEAFIEAARQYEHRNEFVIERLVEMESLGVVIDREKVMKGIKLERDDEIEGVVRVLPYIDELESRAKQAQEWRDQIVSLRNELREARRERDEARVEAQRQKEANARIVERHLQDTARKPQVLVGG